MKNEDIILMNSLRLMDEGILKGCGKTITIEQDGKKKIVELPEEIHTFNGWKVRGYRVRKGEHSKIKFPIWKHTEKAVPDEDKTGNPIEDATIEHMFMKLSAFFTAEQVEAIQ